MKETVKTAVYWFLELLTRGKGLERVISGERIRFSARYCRFYPPTYESAKFKFLRRHCGPGETVLDIGAHIGLFSVLMARCVQPGGRVLCFEPHPQIRTALENTIRINGMTGTCDVRKYAVSRGSGEADFHDTGDEISNAGSLVKIAREVKKFKVPTLSIDELASSEGLDISCIKIDAEGAEAGILLGASETISRSRPAITLEVHPREIAHGGDSLEQIWEFLARKDMKVFDDGRPVDKAWFCGLTEIIEVQILPLVPREWS